ncbi:hypothetical protein D9M71_623810 [compost metagenome]
MSTKYTKVPLAPMIRVPKRPVSTVPLTLLVSGWIVVNSPPPRLAPSRTPVPTFTSLLSTSVSLASTLPVGLTALPLPLSAAARTKSLLATGASKAPRMRMLNCATSVAPAVSRML